MREPGFYWVRVRRNRGSPPLDWEVARWTGEKYWYRCRANIGSGLTDEDFAEIGERIERKEPEPK